MYRLVSFLKGKNALYLPAVGTYINVYNIVSGYHNLS